MSTEQKLAQLRSNIEGKHVLGNVPYDEWERKDRPYCWIEKEKREGYTVWIDTSYGKLALFKDDKYLAWGRSDIILPGVIVKDMDCYDVEKYIWL